MKVGMDHREWKKRNVEDSQGWGTQKGCPH
jgi:hypothetical protein